MSKEKIHKKQNFLYHVSFYLSNTYKYNIHKYKTRKVSIRFKWLSLINRFHKIRDYSNETNGTPDYIALEVLCT